MMTEYPSVFYDYQCFMSPYGGNPLYFSELAFGTDYTPILPSSFKTCNVYYREIAGSQIYSITGNKYIDYAKYFLYSHLNQEQCAKILEGQEFDVFHPTYYDPYFLKHIGEKPYVVMVPDMTHEIFPYMFGNAETIIKNKALVMDNASKIITISENTKKDMMAISGVDESKIVVIPLATSLVPCSMILADLPYRYILFVGNRGVYKNFGLFARVAASVMKSDIHLHLVCAGGGEFSPSEIAMFKSLGILNKVRYHAIRNDLDSVYSKASLFVFPSLYEGFGVPLVEAMACGCPVCCSNTSSFPEIAGNAAVYFNPYDARNMKGAIQEVLENPILRQQMVEEGMRQDMKFSWINTRKQTAAVYREVCKS